MAKVKGVKALNKTVSKQLKPFGISKAQCTDSYAYYFDKNLVTFKITEDAIEDRWFMEFIKKRFGYTVKYPFIFSLLHEVGHSLANEEIVDSLYEFCIAEKERIEKEMQTANSTKSKELEFQYFNLPDEIMATAWAVNYAKNNPKKIKKMWKKCEKSFHKFYAKNLD